MPEDFCELLKEAIKDETEAPKIYEKLRKLAYEKGSRAETKCQVYLADLTEKVLFNIKDDEGRHKELLEKLRAYHCPR
jgi:rubrerythrin